MRDLAGHLTGEVRMAEAELWELCEAFRCPPSVVLEQDRRVVDRMLALRGAERLFATPEADLTEGERAYLEALRDAHPEPRRFVARHANRQRGPLPAEGAR